MTSFHHPGYESTAKDHPEQKKVKEFASCINRLYPTEPIRRWDHRGIYRKEKEINCEILDVDRYKRYVSECLVNNININKYMVQYGWAIAYRYYSEDYIEEEFIAENKKIGIWKGKFIDPYLYRKKNRN